MNERVGYRFRPTDEELVDYFLRRKLDETLHSDDIRLLDICNFEPWELPKYAAQVSNEEEWYFFHKRVLKNRNTSKPRYNRSTKTGHWKPTGKDKPVKAKRNRIQIGVKRTLVFYKYAKPNDLKTNWVIHEYETKASSPHQEDLVLCKLREKVNAEADTTVACCEAESSHSSSFEIHSPQVPSSQTLPPISDGANLEEPCTLQPQIQLDEGFSIDDLGLTNDIFQNGSNGLMNQSETTTELQQDKLDLLKDVEEIKLPVQELARRTAHLEEITQMDCDSFCRMYYSHYEDSNLNLNNGHTSSTEYPQMLSNFSTETLPAAPRTVIQSSAENLPLSPSSYDPSGSEMDALDSNEFLQWLKSLGSSDSNVGSPKMIFSIGRAWEESPTPVVPYSYKQKSIKKTFKVGKRQFEVKWAGLSKFKARQARKHDMSLNSPPESLKEQVTVRSNSKFVKRQERKERKKVRILRHAFRQLSL